MKNLIVAALLASAVAVPASAAELVANGGFESPNGLNHGWSHTVSNTLYIVDNQYVAQEGTHFIQFLAEADYLSDFIYQTLDTVAGQSYTYSYWLSAATTNADAPSNFHATIGGQGIGNFDYSGTFDWLHITGSYVATSDQTEIYFEGFNTLGLYALDNVSVTGPLAGEIDPGGPTFPGGGNGVPEPATWAMMLLGFFGIGATLRRRNLGGQAVAA